MENESKIAKLSYKKLWIRLIEMNMSKAQFRRAAGLSTGVMTKLRKGEPVSMETLYILCKTCKCNIGDICEFEFNINEEKAER